MQRNKTSGSGKASNYSSYIMYGGLAWLLYELWQNYQAASPATPMTQDAFNSMITSPPASTPPSYCDQVAALPPNQFAAV